LQRSILGIRKRAEHSDREERAQSLLHKIPRTVRHRREHEGPWHVGAPEIRNQGNLDALFTESLRSLGTPLVAKLGRGLDAYVSEL